MPRRSPPYVKIRRASARARLIDTKFQHTESVPMSYYFACVPQPQGWCISLPTSMLQMNRSPHHFYSEPHQRQGWGLLLSCDGESSLPSAMRQIPSPLFGFLLELL